MIVGIRFGVFYRIRLTGSSAIFSMFSMVFEGLRGYLTNDLTSFLEGLGIKKKRPPDEGWPLVT